MEYLLYTEKEEIISGGGGNEKDKMKVVVLGGGFGGLSAASELSELRNRSKDVGITFID